MSTPNSKLNHYKQINTMHHTNDLFNKHDELRHRVNAVSRHIVDSVISLNEVTYKENLILLSTYLDELVKLNDGFYLSGMIDDPS